MIRHVFHTLLIAAALSIGVNSAAAETIAFCAAGDILLDRGCGAMIRRYGYDYPFAEVGDLIRSHDLAFANLECPISSRGKALPNPITFKADSSLIEVLKRSGFSIFNLANNHMLDYGQHALLDTRRILKEHGFYTVGSGNNADEAREMVIVEKRGVKVAFLTYVDVTGFGPMRATDRPCPAFLDTLALKDGIGRARTAADFIVVSPHWGIEYADRPSERQMAFAHLAIDSGADIVIGHHPHVLQSIEKYRGKYILYSLGNFVFDQHHPPKRESALFTCVLHKGKITSPCIVPIVLPERTFRPVIPGCDDAKRLLERVKKISDGFGVTFRDGDSVLFLE